MRCQAALHYAAGHGAAEDRGRSQAGGNAVEYQNMQSPVTVPAHTVSSVKYNGLLANLYSAAYVQVQQVPSICCQCLLSVSCPPSL